MTVESFDAHEARDDFRRANQQVKRVVIAAVVFVSSVLIGNQVWLDQRIVHSTQRSDCASRKLDAALYDAALLARRDTNVHDYKRAPKC